MLGKYTKTFEDDQNESSKKLSERAIYDYKQKLENKRIIEIYETG